jgi:hypothetical protein
MKELNKLVKELCRREGLKSQTSIANVREIVGHLSDIIYKDLANISFYFEDPDGVVLRALYVNGHKRSKKKKK